jgi:hypothetical protein
MKLVYFIFLDVSRNAMVAVIPNALEREPGLQFDPAICRSAAAAKSAKSAAQSGRLAKS